MKKELYNLIGLSAKSGSIFTGTSACENGIRRKRIYLVLLDGNASQNTVKDFTNMCKYYKIELLVLKEKDMLANCIGKSGIKVVGISNENLAREIKRKANSIPGGK